MKVKELKEFLLRFDDDIEVRATWEGCYTPLEIKNATIGRDKLLNVDCLVFDVEDYDVGLGEQEVLNDFTDETERKYESVRVE